MDRGTEGQVSGKGDGLVVGVGRVGRGEQVVEEWRAEGAGVGGE